MDIEAAVAGVLRGHPAVRSAVLAGSRAGGEPNELSDWDFSVEARDFERLAAELPVVVEPLGPILRQWDRLGHVATYMLMLADGTKIDLIFPAVAQEEAAPWVASAGTLQGIDDHFWDWIVWLASKDLGGKAGLVGSELERLYTHILGPAGVGSPATTVSGAVEAYVAARDARARELGVRVSLLAQEAVLGRLRGAEFGV
jgi:hypothetical protein